VVVSVVPRDNEEDHQDEVGEQEDGNEVRHPLEVLVDHRRAVDEERRHRKRYD